MARAQLRGEPQRPPAFQFFARAWLASTMGMAHDVAGVYIRLLAWSWDAGPLPDDPIWRGHMLGPDADRLWTAIRSKWKLSRRGWINRRLEAQRRELAEFRARAQRGAASRWDQASAKTPDRISTPISDLRSPKKKNPAAPVPFRVYVAIAHQAIDDEPTDDLGAIAERFKTACAQQRLPYDSRITQKAIDQARAARARKRA